MNFKTQRLTIGDFREKDIIPFSKYRNDDEWMKYQSFKGMSIEKYREILLSKAKIEDGKQLAIILTQTDELIGDLYICKSGDCCNIGYTISPKFARKGLVTEAVKGTINELAKLGVTNCFAYTDEGNVASIAFLKKIGFQQLANNEEDGYKFSYVL